MEDGWAQALAERSALGLLRQTEVLQPAPGMRPLYHDAAGRLLLSFASNDYLGLARHPALREAAQQSFAVGEFGSGAAPLLGGERRQHAELAAALASWLGVEAVLLFGSGYLANLGVFGALTSAQDHLFLDRLAHASLIDGARLSGARLQRFRHNDLEHLETLLRKPRSGRAWIVSEGVFSMDGDLAPLPELLALAQRYDAALILDEAHAFGVLGREGRGSVEHWQCDGDALILRIGTLGKAFGSYGAFVASSAFPICWLQQAARSYLFHTALPASLAAATLAALPLLQQAQDRREHLQRLRQRLQAGLHGRPFLPSQTPIQGLILGSNAAALAAAAALRAAGIYCPAVRPPTVPQGQARLRISLSAAHSIEDIEQLLHALERV
ncbi:8-amino-7-oxononanoate synthase [Acidithiobacillus sp. AMEEHan]|uniref:aminotransferase class I/II-fold pyridoxal phosphate-dependent enzyme n=1 Tax=Acidithiobacillus sp. AMEEHan TaxID=2994951 RepID=UPI0027E48B57|nr:8-amino-7-oxononanoate synthase [Acidithiobacillus sp. AMEEHan]